MRIAVDAMGGDNAPAAEVQGAIEAARAFGVEIVLVGDEQRIRAEAARHGGLPPTVTIVDASEVITPHEEPTKAVRAKPNASLVVAAQLVKEGKADALLSAGSTGALVVVATLGIGRVKGIERPALGPIFPTIADPVMVLDIGATPDPKPEYLVQYAIMGNIYAREVLGIAQPRVALLNNGTEAGKGSALTKATYPLLEQLKDIHFIGNVEGRDVPFHRADVVVTDGFSGNIFLKTYEGVGMALMQAMKEALTSTPMASLGALLAKPALKKMAKKFDWAETGGALLLGLKAPIVKCHGSSGSKAIRGGIRVMQAALAGQVTAKLAAAISDANARNTEH